MQITINVMDYSSGMLTPTLAEQGPDGTIYDPATMLVYTPGDPSLTGGVGWEYLSSTPYTPPVVAPPAPIEADANAATQMTPGTYLAPGEGMTDSTGAFTLHFGFDGDLHSVYGAGNVTEDGRDASQPLWNAGTAAVGGLFHFRQDGSLVITDAAGNDVWRAPATGARLAFAPVVEGSYDTGGLTLYDAAGNITWKTPGIAAPVASAIDNLVISAAFSTVAAIGTMGISAALAPAVATAVPVADVAPVIADTSAGAFDAIDAASALAQGVDPATMWGTSTLTDLATSTATQDAVDAASAMYDDSAVYDPFTPSAATVDPTPVATAPVEPTIAPEPVVDTTPVVPDATPALDTSAGALDSIDASAAVDAGIDPGTLWTPDPSSIDLATANITPVPDVAPQPVLPDTGSMTLTDPTTTPVDPFNTPDTFDTPITTPVDPGTSAVDVATSTATDTAGSAGGGFFTPDTLVDVAKVTTGAAAVVGAVTAATGGGGGGGGAPGPTPPTPTPVTPALASMFDPKTLLLLGGAGLVAFMMFGGDASPKKRTRKEAR